PFIGSGAAGTAGPITLLLNTVRRAHTKGTVDPPTKGPNAIQPCGVDVSEILVPRGKGNERADAQGRGLPAPVPAADNRRAIQAPAADRPGDVGATGGKIPEGVAIKEPGIAGVRPGLPIPMEERTIESPDPRIVRRHSLQLANRTGRRAGRPALAV